MFNDIVITLKFSTKDIFSSYLLIYIFRIYMYIIHRQISFWLNIILVQTMVTRTLYLEILPENHY